MMIKLIIPFTVNRTLSTSIKRLETSLGAIIVLRAKFLSHFHINNEIAFFCLLLAHHLIFKLEYNELHDDDIEM